MIRKVLIPSILGVFLIGCDETPQQPQVSFTQDVKPLIDKNCTECHSAGKEGMEASGFGTVDYESIMKGTKYGPVIFPGNAISSSFYRLIAGKVDPSIRMPHGKEPISEENIAKVETWIDQGAKNNCSHRRKLVGCCRLETKRKAILSLGLALTVL